MKEHTVSDFLVGVIVSPTEIQTRQISTPPHTQHRMNYVRAAMLNSEMQSKNKKKKKTTSHGKNARNLYRDFWKNNSVLWHRYGVLIFKI